MRRRIVLLSGPVAVGKTGVSSRLEVDFGFRTLKTRQLIAEAGGTPVERAALQKAGDVLDRRTRGEWVAKALSRLIEGDDGRDVIVDAVRNKNQIDAVRAAYSSSVVHIHLTANLDVLAERYRGRHGSVKELRSYAEVRRNATERQVESLARHADIVIRTDTTDPNGVIARVAGRLGLYGRSVERLVDVVVGGSSAAKGRAVLRPT